MKSKDKSPSRPKTKKELVLQGSSRRPNPFILAVSLALILVAAGAAYMVVTRSAPPAEPTRMSGTAAAQPGEASAAPPGEVTYPLASFSDGKARHFEYRHKGMEIRYFILKSADGVVRAAFDACDVCWPSGKGYEQSGDEMVCRNCGKRFASIKINEIQGGCNPAPLQRSIRGDQLVIRIQDIVQGQTYFNFKGRV